MVEQYQLRGHSGPVAEQVIKLVEQDITLGRDLASDIVISDSEVSRTHARLSWQDDGYVIQDLKSTNGTWINGRPVIAASRLTAGDLVTLGKVSVFVYEPIPGSEIDTTRDLADPEPAELIESTMAMPAWQGEVLKARQVINSKSPQLQRQREQVSPVAPTAVEGQPILAEEPASGGRLFHQQYTACLQSGDLRDLLSQYHPDATVLSIEGGATGASDIAKFFQQYFGGLGSFRARPTGRYVEGPDSILCETRVETGEIIARVHDVFVLRNGKATHQFTCTVEVTPRVLK